MKITTIGCGRWGSLITWYLNRKGEEMTLYGKADSKQMQEFLSTRKNSMLTLPLSIKLSLDIEESLNSAEIIILSVPSQNLRDLMNEIHEYNVKNKIFVLCMKGLEIETGKRLSEIVEEYIDETNKVAVWLGPGHVEEFYKEVPNCMIIDSKDSETKKKLVNEFSSDLIRFYYGQDIIGNEIGAASKNVIGIAAGMLDGLGLSTLKGALMSRGAMEVSKLIKACGGNELSAYGLCHLGDYEATVFSHHSHNRAFGEAFIKGEKYEGGLAEGYYTVKAIHTLEEKYNIEMPICDAVYALLFENADKNEIFHNLFTRPLKKEFK